MTTRTAGRPRKNTEPVKLNLSTLLLSEIRTKRPWLLKPDTVEWRHGALSGWVENLLWKELRGTNAPIQSQLVHRRLGGGQSDDFRVSPGEPGSGVQTGRIASGGDSAASGELGTAADGDAGTGDEVYDTHLDAGDRSQR